MSREQLYYDVLRRIAKDYMTPAQIRRSAERDHGLAPSEMLEMVYENIQAEAALAIKGQRRPKDTALAATASDGAPRDGEGRS